MKNETKLKVLKIWLIIVFLLLFFIETKFRLPYIYKSLYKISILGIISSIIFYIITRKNIFNFLKFKIDLSVFKWIIPTVLGLTCTYLVVKDLIDFNDIKFLIDSIGINQNTYLGVSIYIVFINSFLEEYFFRGLYFLNIKDFDKTEHLGHLSALFFSLYHTSILINWFELWIFIVVLFALYAVGLFFNYLNIKTKNILNSYLVHLSANFTICTIGYIVMFM